MSKKAQPVASAKIEPTITPVSQVSSSYQPRAGWYHLVKLDPNGNEIREAKDKLSASIRDMVLDFEKETGTSISHFQMNRVFVYIDDLENKEHPVNTTIDIRVEV